MKIEPMIYRKEIRQLFQGLLIILSCILLNPLFAENSQDLIDSKTMQVEESKLEGSESEESQMTTTTEDEKNTETQIENEEDQQQLDTLVTDSSPFGEEPSMVKEGIRTVFFLLFLLAGFWWVSAWLKKSGKLRAITGDANIQCQSVYSVGPKEKVVLLKVKNQEILIGITQHTIQPLHVFSPTLDEQEPHDQIESEEEFEKVIEGYQKPKEHSS